jgi:hypothetical protein
MIIFGTKGYLYQLAIVTLLCGGCGNPSAHTVRKRVTKFSLFFVPLFPISTKYSTQCTFCGVEQKVSKEQADQLLAQNAAPGPGNLQGGGQPFGQSGGQDGGQAYGQGQQPGQQNPYQS